MAEAEVCSSCGKPAQRALPGKKVTEALPSEGFPTSKRVHLCRDHYKKYKKATRVDRELQRADW